jgi:exodeoxyribonuclease VII small subunit
MPDPRMPFEKALARLEQIVKEIEAPDVPLDRALALFEEGKKLSGLCQDRLRAAEQKVSELIQTEEGKPALQEFEPEEDTEDDEN